MAQSGGGFKLFGVQITTNTVGSIKKSSSTSNISSQSLDLTDFQIRSGYASDDPMHSNPHIERKKGIPWTVEEHRKFLVGLKERGKGDWRGISRDYVMTRTPLQVASHAQKYFVHQTNTSRRKRTSLFDITDPEMHIYQPAPVKYEQLQLRQGQGPELSGNPIPQGPKEAVLDNTKILLPPAPVLYPVATPVHCSFCCPPPPTFPVLPKEPGNVDKGMSVSPLRIGEGQ